MSIFDYYALEKYFLKLIGKYFDKISHYYGNYKLKLGKDIVIIPGKATYITQYSLKCQNPDNFCLFIRKRLKNQKLKNFRIINLQRILEFEFEDYYLILENFGKGNIILCDKEYNVLKDLQNIKKYEFPEFNLKSIPPFVKEEAKFLNVELNDLIKELIEKSKMSETLYIYDNFFAPFELNHKDYIEKKPLLEGYDELFCEKYLIITIVKDESEKIRKYRLKELEKAKEELNKLENILNKIYTHYSEIEFILNKIKDMNEEEINKKLKIAYEKGLIPFKMEFKKPYLEIEFNNNERTDVFK